MTRLCEVALDSLLQDQLLLQRASHVCAELPYVVNVSALLSVMLAPGRRRFQLVKFGALNSMRELKVFTKKFILALCQGYERHEEVATIVEIEILVVVDTYMDKESGDTFPWEELLGRGIVRTTKMAYPKTFCDESVPTDTDKGKHRLWTVFRWENDKTRRAMNLMINTECEGENTTRRQYVVAFYLRFEA